MNYRTSLFAAGAAIAFAGLANAQEYGLNWAITSNPGIDGAISGKDLFSPDPTLPDNFASDGDSIRKCHGIDQTQGGSNQTGQFSNTLFRVIQGWAAANAQPGVQIGLVSIHSQSIPSLAGDACFTAYFNGFQPATLNEQLNAWTIIGTVNTPNPFPFVYDIVFRWTPTPVTGPTTLGTDANGYPLLASVIYEVQGPVNGNQSTNQYYLVSTTEVTGLNANRPGGIANGNALLGSALLGANADQSNAVAATRLTSFQGGFLIGETMFGPLGEWEMHQNMAFSTPQLWATNNGNGGTGGPDWRISGPVSSVNARFLDVLSGAQSTPGTTAFNPCVLFNSAIFLWSATPAIAMLQRPMSWDSTFVPFLPPQPGSIAMGFIPTARHGAQTVPVNFDSLTAAFLGVSNLTLGTAITPASSQYANPNTTLSLATLFQGGFDPIVNGIVGFSGGAGPLSAVPKPNLAGLQLGLAAVGLQFDACFNAIVYTEFASSLHVSLQ